MNVSREQVQSYILGKLEELSQDWDPPRKITPSSLLFTGLGFESLDAVILGVAIQEHFGCEMPFAGLFAELGASQRDLSVAELTDFAFRHTNSVAEAPRADA